MANLSPETSRLIAEAIAAGRITRLTEDTPSVARKRGRPPKGAGVGKQKIDERQAMRAAAGVVRVRDRRRFKLTPVADGIISVLAPANATGTIFRSRVEEIGDAPVFKDGAWNSKIGGDVLVGRLRGAKIFTLTLEEYPF